MDGMGRGGGGLQVKEGEEKQENEKGGWTQEESLFSQISGQIPLACH